MKSTNGLFIKKTQREKYEEKIIKDSGKNNTIVNAWLNAAASSLKNPIAVNNNFIEHGQFLSNDSFATAYFISLKEGQKIVVTITKLKNSFFNVYMDLWRKANNSNTLPVFIVAADTVSNQITFTALREEKLIIRFQQLLSNAGNYKFEIKTGPSFLFPITETAKSNIGSLWGDGRDGGTRKHEGIDIFAPKKSLAVAVADGIVSSVSESALGGKYVFFNPIGTEYNVYYAHLDSQLVKQGQKLVKGQPIGLVGNTGNARTTPPHLHFGIYSMYGAIDPLLFVKQIPNTNKKDVLFPQRNTTTTNKPAKLLNDLILKTAITTLEKNSKVKINAVTESYYKITTADGRKGFIQKADVIPM